MTNLQFNIGGEIYACKYTIRILANEIFSENIFIDCRIPISRITYRSHLRGDIRIKNRKLYPKFNS